VGKIAAIILAAGESFRFGKPKQLLQLNKKSLVRRIADEAHNAGCSPIIVVVGSARDEVESALAGTTATTVDNENWKRGIGTSIRTGIECITKTAEQVEGVVLLVCDQPLVDATTIRNLIAVRQNTGKAIVASGYAQTVGVPALFDRACFDELRALDSDSGAKLIILSDIKRVAELPFPDGAIDVDTLPDWENLGNPGQTKE
jgi:molybdenum cofactor cytidylyltransferase